MIEEKLVDFGIAGIFILYLIYDRQITMKNIINALNGITNEVKKCPKVK